MGVTWWRWHWRWRWKLTHWKMLRKSNDIVPTYRKILAQISNVKFFTVDPYFGVVFPPDTQKVLKTSTSSSVRPWLRGSSYSSQLKWISISMRQSTVGLKCWWLRRCCWRVEWVVVALVRFSVQTVVLVEEQSAAWVDKVVLRHPRQLVDRNRVDRTDLSNV